MKIQRLLKDILKSIGIFKSSLEKILYFFLSFGEYSLEFKKIIKDLGFKYAFGQHSGVIDETKDLWNYQDFLSMKNMVKYQGLKHWSKPSLLNTNLFIQRKIFITI